MKRPVLSYTCFELTRLSSGSYFCACSI